MLVCGNSSNRTHANSYSNYHVSSRMVHLSTYLYNEMRFVPLRQFFLFKQKVLIVSELFLSASFPYWNNMCRLNKENLAKPKICNAKHCTSLFLNQLSSSNRALREFVCYIPNNHIIISSNTEWTNERHTRQTFLLFSKSSIFILALHHAVDVLFLRTVYQSIDIGCDLSISGFVDNITSHQYYQLFFFF